VLIEIAIAEITLPIDADQIAAHDMLEIFTPVGSAQRLLIAIELTL
jgi:hypothetical protein